jgi:hypothetical protein
MRRIAFLVLVLVLVTSCKKERKSPPELAPIASVPVPDDSNDEELRICRELYPCKDKGPDPFDRGFCARESRPYAVPYTADGVKLVAHECEIRNGSMLDIVGITPTGARIRDHDLYRRIQGSMEARVQAARDIFHGGGRSELNDRGEPCVIEEKDGWLSFCVGGYPHPENCLVRADGAHSCGINAGREAYRACREITGREVLTANEGNDRFTGEAVANPESSLSAQPSHDAINRAYPGASHIALRAKGLRIHSAVCSWPYPEPIVWARWGVDEKGNLVIGRALVPHLDTIEARAATSAELNGLTESARLITDAPIESGGTSGGLPPRTCELPPGPRESNGVLTFYVQTITNEGELRRCDIATSNYRGACVAVKPRERFCLPN